MGNVRRLWSLALITLLVVLCACVRQREGDAGSVEVFRAGQLSWNGDSDVAEVAYVGLCDTAGGSGRIVEATADNLRAGGFDITGNPSKAGYILQIFVVDAGLTEPEGLPALVHSGYGSSAHFSGRGGVALLADVLLVRRRIPSHKRPSRARLKNISSRNALGNSQMRLGLLVRGDLDLKNGLPGYIAEALAREITADMPPLEDSSEN